MLTYVKASCNLTDLRRQVVVDSLMSARQCLVVHIIGVISQITWWRFVTYVVVFVMSPCVYVTLCMYVQWGVINSV